MTDTVAVALTCPDCAHVLETNSSFEGCCPKCNRELTYRECCSVCWGWQPCRDDTPGGWVCMRCEKRVIGLRDAAAAAWERAVKQLQPTRAEQLYALGLFTAPLTREIAGKDIAEARHAEEMADDSV